MKRTYCNGPATVLGEHVSKPVPKRRPKGPRKDNELIDVIANETDKIKLINNCGNNGKKVLTEK